MERTSSTGPDDTSVVDMAEHKTKSKKKDIPTINIDLDKACSQCGKEGALDSGRCLNCISDSIRDAHEDVAKFTVPFPDKFAGKSYLPAPELEALADELIIRYPNDFEHLHGARIVYLWKEKGGESSGYAVLGKCIRPTGLADYFASDQGDAFSKVDFVVWCAADHLLVNQANKRTVYALLFHELKHTSIVDGKYVVVGHEFEGFAREIEEFGMWRSSIKKIAEACDTLKDVQQGLFTNYAS